MSPLPAWLIADPLAKKLLAEGMNEDEVMELVERSAIIEEGAKVERQEAERLAAGDDCPFHRRAT